MSGGWIVQNDLEDLRTEEIGESCRVDASRAILFGDHGVQVLMMTAGEVLLHRLFAPLHWLVIAFNLSFGLSILSRRSMKLRVAIKTDTLIALHHEGHR